MKRTFTQICELLILDMPYKNLCKKTSFLATDATTKSSDQEDNEKGEILFIYCKIMQLGKTMTR
jgi:hypothetical protein